MKDENEFAQRLDEAIKEVSKTCEFYKLTQVINTYDYDDPHGLRSSFTSHGQVVSIKDGALHIEYVLLDK